MLPAVTAVPPLAPTQPASPRPAPPGAGAATDGPRPATRARRRRLLGAVAVALLLGACSIEKVDEAHVGVHYTDGPIEGQRFDSVVEPGGSRTVVNDHVYRLPARQVTYIASASDSGDRGPLTLTASSGEHLELELAVRFFLNSREEALRPFFLEICQKHDCWDDDGWVAMLNETFGNPAQAVINDVGLQFDAEALRYDNATRDEFATTFAGTFRESQQRLVGRGDYFCGPGYDRDVADEDDEAYCPPLSVEVTSVTFVDPERENIREQQALAAEQEELAAAQAEAARAQQEVNAARATPEYLALQEAEAMRACADNPECQLTVIVGSDDVGVSVPAG